MDEDRECVLLLVLHQEVWHAMDKEVPERNVIASIGVDGLGRSLASSME